MSSETRPEKLASWADALLTLWVILVAVVYFAPPLAPLVGLTSAGRVIGAWTEPASVVYALLAVTGIVRAVLGAMRRHGTGVSAAPPS